MEEILELVGAPVIICSADGEIEWASTQARDHFGEIPHVSDWTVGPSAGARSAMEALINTAEEKVEVWLGASDPPRVARASLTKHEGRFVVTLNLPYARDAEGPSNRPPDHFLRLSPHGTIRYTSGPCMGKPPEEVLGKVFFDLLPPEWGEPLRIRLAELRVEPVIDLTQSRVEIYGGMRSFSQKIIPIVADEEVVEFVFQSWDITDDVRAADVLKVTEEQYRQVIDNSLDLVGIFEAETTRLQFVSPNSLEILGFRYEEVVGRPIFDFIEEADQEITRQRIEDLVAFRSSHETIEVRAHHANGDTVLLEARARLFPNDVDERLIIMNARDITQRHESQLLRRNLMRADKLAAIGQVAASVAHEVNNPASFITTNLHVMRDDLKAMADLVRSAHELLVEHAPAKLSELTVSAPVELLLEELIGMVDTNLEGMNRISHIVRELRSFSRTDDEGTMEFVDVTDTLRAACNMVRNQITYFAELRESVSPDLPLVYTDRGKVSQVAVNLLVNASQAIQNAPRDREHVVEVRAFLEEGVVRVDVTDTGCGVDPDSEKRIFDPFFTTKNEDEGTGLGLWLCKEIVETCGGRLWLERSDSGGSCFSFTLPAQSLVEIPATPFEEVSSSASDNAESRRVLLIDDDELVLESYRKILGRHHDIVVARGGEHAIKILNRDSRFDVIVCDIIMPGVDGKDVYRFLGNHHPELASVTYFCTAGVFTDRTREFVSKVRDRVIHKPISARQLKSLVINSAPTDEPDSESI